MKLSHLAQRNPDEPGRIAYNAAMYIAIEKHDGRDALVCRPHKSFLENEAFMAVFERQGAVTESYTHPQCLRYVSYETDELGPYWVLTPGRYTSLARLMVEKPDLRLDEKWVDQTISNLIEVTEYANNQRQVQLELTPNSILISKDAKSRVVLMPPLTDFIPLKKEIWPEPNEQLAPEIFNIEEPDQHADIYGIGRIIQYLYPYPSLPYKYASLVKSAIGERVDKRPGTLTDVQSSIKKKGRNGALAQILVTLLVVSGIIAILLLYPWENNQEHEFRDLKGADTTLFDDGYLTKSNSLDPLVNTDIQTASEAEKARMLENYLNDSTYMSMDTAYSLSPEMKEYQREMMKMAEEKFRTAFKVQARPILAKVYTKQNLNNQEVFLQKSAEANEQLVNIQQSMAKQYQIDPTTANRIISEVYDEVVESIKSTMK